MDDVIIETEHSELKHEEEARRGLSDKLTVYTMNALFPDTDGLGKIEVGGIFPKLSSKTWFKGDVNNSDFTGFRLTKPGEPEFVGELEVVIDPAKGRLLKFGAGSKDGSHPFKGEMVLRTGELSTQNGSDHLIYVPVASSDGKMATELIDTIIASHLNMAVKKVK
jgi:hypothetical protein